jgi:hypothetical protein
MLSPTEALKEEQGVASGLTARPQPEAGVAAKFTIDYLMEAAKNLRPDCDPGVRMVAGRPYVYDANLLRSFECRATVRSAEGVKMDRLSDAILETFVSAGLRRWADTKHGDTAAVELAERALAEQRRRAQATIPTLEPITATVRQLDPAIWGVSTPSLQAAE